MSRAFRYAPAMSAVATSLLLYASIIIDWRRPSEETVGDAVSDFSYTPCCDLPSATMRPFSRPQRFFLIRFIALSAALRWARVREATWTGS